MDNWLQKLSELQQQGITCMMVSVASVTGSTPREVGAKMLVTPDSMFGTIGGGNLEFQACSIARDQMQSKQMRRFPLGAGLGQCCGGLVNLLFEPMTGETDWIDIALEYESQNRSWVREVPMDEEPVRIRQYQDEATGLLDSGWFIEVNRPNYIELILFGAGHVGRALIETMRHLPVQIRWIDSRDNVFPSQVPDNVETVCTDSPEAEVDLAESDAYFLVMTHDHALDQLLCEQILKRDDFAYFGLIGSQSKRRMFETRMKRRGMDEEKFERITCPIGIDGIEGKQPAMIAISVAAQIMQGYDSSTQKIQQKRTRVSSTPGRGS